MLMTSPITYSHPHLNSTFHRGVTSVNIDYHIEHIPTVLN